jgi:sugar phosphate isomerase/epimerase
MGESDGIRALDHGGGTVYVCCSTLCFSRQPLDRALRMIGELEFSKVDVAIRTQGPHLAPAEVIADPAKAALRLRIGPGLSVAAFKAEIDAPDAATFDRQFLGICKLARSMGVALVSLPAAAAGADLDAEVKRLTHLTRVASREGVVLTVPTRMGTLTETPDTAVALCERVPGLGLALDPSHYICGPHQGKSYDQVFPFVRHVYLRDTGRTPDKLQVRIGQGEVEYSKILSQLERHGYDRLLTVEIGDQPEPAFNVPTEVRKLKYLLESLA